MRFVLSSVAAFGRTKGLRKLIVDRLAIDRFQMLLAAAINVEQIDEIFPTLVERCEI